MGENDLVVDNLCVSIEGKEVVKNVSFTIPTGQTHLLFGPNGSGKTSLLLSIIGMPQYKITSGKIIYKGKDITNLPMNERSKLGVGISLQKPPVIKGVTLKKILSTISKKLDKELIKVLNMEDYLLRDINVGFSGGEIKRSEMLQLAHQKSDLILLDEPESGVDIENLKTLGTIAGYLLEKNRDVKIRDRRKIGLIITHTGYILNYLEADMAYIMIDGRINCTGNPREIFREIQTKGFKECSKCLQKE